MERYECPLTMLRINLPVMLHLKTAAGKKLNNSS